jgi:predicted NBD/HSP70 family sugar kinase
MKAANRDFIREVNLFNILNSIREEGLISRTEIAHKTGQSRASVTNITALLIEQKLIRESKCQCDPTRGRRRIMLSLNPEAAFTVGIKVSAFKLSFAIVDFVGDVKSSLSIPFRVRERSETVLVDLIEDGVHHCLKDARLSRQDISGCGLAIPGFVDSASDTCYWNPLKEGQSNIRTMLSQRLAMEVYLENDANSVTVASQWFGLGKGIDNFLVVTIEHGVGMGIVIDGKLYRGTGGIGAEFGHMVMVPDGALCRCGKRGCLEAYTADSAILQRARECLSSRRGSKPDIDTLTIEDVTILAEEGDKELRKIFRQAGEMLGRGIGGLIQIFSPEKVVITGEGVRAGDLLFSPMKRALKKYVNKEQAKISQVVIQEWSDDAWARGAAGFVLGELYKSPLNRIHRSA